MYWLCDFAWLLLLWEHHWNNFKISVLIVQLCLMNGAHGYVFKMIVFLRFHGKSFFYYCLCDCVIVLDCELFFLFYGIGCKFSLIVWLCDYYHVDCAFLQFLPCWLCNCAIVTIVAFWLCDCVKICILIVWLCENMQFDCAIVRLCLIVLIVCDCVVYPEPKKQTLQQVSSLFHVTSMSTQRFVRKYKMLFW